MENVITVQRLPLAAVLAKPLTFVLSPPALRFYVTHILALLASLAVVLWSVADGLGWLGQAGFGLIHWVGIIFGGSLLLLSLWPPSWNRKLLINLAFDEQLLYLVNGPTQEAISVPRDRVRAVNHNKLPGHDGAIIAFTLDLNLSDAELAAVQETLAAKVEERFQLDDNGYRFGFVANWQRRRKLLATIAVLAPAVVAPVVVDEDEDDDWD